MPVIRLKVRELDPLHGDHVKVMTLERAKTEIQWLSLVGTTPMVTVLPNGEQVKSFDELLKAITAYPDQEEIELMRFPPMAGG